MNDFVRDKLTDKKGNIAPHAEILAGCCVSIVLYLGLCYLFNFILFYRFFP